LGAELMAHCISRFAVCSPEGNFIPLLEDRRHSVGQGFSPDIKLPYETWGFSPGA